MKNRRRTKLVMPEIQKKALWAGAIFSLTLLVAQAIVIVFSVHRVAALAPEESARILAELPSIVLLGTALAFGTIVPAMLALVLGGTHRIVGPLFRMQRTMKEHLAGQDVGDLKLREGDELQEFAALLDRVLKGERAAPVEDVPAEADQADAGEAAPVDRAA